MWRLSLRVAHEVCQCTYVRGGLYPAAELREVTDIGALAKALLQKQEAVIATAQVGAVFKAVWFKLRRTFPKLDAVES